MPNTRKNFVPDSIGHGMENPFIVRMPCTDPGGIFDATGLTANTPVTLNGSFCKNISTDGFSADMRLPIVPVITTEGKADVPVFRVRGWDQFGQYREETLNKSNVSLQTQCPGLIAWSKIKDITPTATLAKRTRIGMVYASRLDLTANREFETMTVALNQGGISRRIPLPYRPKSTSDIQVRYLGTEPEQPTTFITASPSAADLTFTATDVDSSAAWDLSGVAVGDVMYTLDGYAGIVTTVDDAGDNLACAGGWFKEGVAGTPGVPGTGVVTGWTNKVPWVRVVRYNVVYPYSTLVTGGTATYSATAGGLIPGHRVLPLTNTSNVGANDIAGVDIQSATFGFLPALPSETPFDLLFEITVKQGALY